MSKKFLYAVYDKKAKIYDGFMILENQAQAVRAFAQACQQNTTFKTWPEDFEIYELGQIYVEQGKIVPHENNIFLSAATSFVEKKQNEETPTNDKK